MALINNPIKTDTTTYDPEKIQLDQQDTVEGRVASLIQKNSPLNDLARTEARQITNRRGLLNSSITAGETYKSLIQNALPIASQDANTSFQAKSLNQQAGNQAGQFNAGQLNTSALNERQGQQAIEQIQERGKVEGGLIGKELAAQKELQQLKGSQSLEQIQASGDVESRLIGERGDIEKELATAEGQRRMDLLNRQGQIDTELQQLRGTQAIDQINLNTESQSRLQAEQGEIQKQLQTADAATRERLLNRQGEIDKELTQLNADTAMQRLKAQGVIERDLQVLRGDQQQALADLEGRWGMLRQTSQSAATIMQTASAGLAAILSNPDIAATAKQSLIDKQIDLLRQQLDIVGIVGDVDLSDVLQILPYNPGSSSPGSTPFNPASPSYNTPISPGIFYGY